ncbi:MAG: hypothetical protein Q8O89_08050 [Nanoarchaeota archaeon]|nr:hypothetical protein [Nanoarchaeota archaeon]
MDKEIMEAMKTLIPLTVFVEAGFYGMKYVGYYYLQNAFTPKTKSSKEILNAYTLGAILPTPFDAPVIMALAYAVKRKHCKKDRDSELESKLQDIEQNAEIDQPTITEQGPKKTGVNGINKTLTAIALSTAIATGAYNAKAETRPEIKPEIKSLKENIIATTEDAPISRMECLIGGLPEKSTVYFESTRNFQTDKTLSLGRLDVPVYDGHNLLATVAVKYTNPPKTKTEEELGLTLTFKGKKGRLTTRYFPEGHRIETIGSYPVNKRITIDQLSSLNTKTEQASFRPAINYALGKDKALRIEASYAGRQNNLKQTYVGVGMQFKLK